MAKEKKLGSDAAAVAADFRDDAPNPEVVRRLNELVSVLGTRTQAAERAGVRYGTLRDALEGRSQPRFSTVARLAEAAGRSLDWVYTGRDAAQLVPLAEPIEGFVLVPVLPEAVSAGAGALLDANDLEVEKQVAFRGEWMRRIGVNPKRAHVLRVKGDSMEPTLSEGDVVLVDTADTEPAGGGLYVLNWSGEAIVKRLDRDFDGALLVISDAGQRYPPRRIDAAAADQVRIIGRVRWYARTIR